MSRSCSASQGRGTRAKTSDKLRMNLAESVGERPNRLFPRFDQYVEAVLLHFGYRLEPIRAELDAGLERLAQPLLATGSLDEKSFDDLCERMESAAEGVSTVTGLVSLYRNVISDIRSAIESPTNARQDRGTRRALAFMREHSSDAITLSQVARAAGFAPDYFSRLFHRAEGVTFERHLQRLRVSNAMRMLRGTDLGLDGVSRLSGFSNRGYFHRVFKAAVGLTPIEYRRRTGVRRPAGLGTHRVERVHSRRAPGRVQPAEDAHHAAADHADSDARSARLEPDHDFRPGLEVHHGELDEAQNERESGAHRRAAQREDDRLEQERGDDGEAREPEGAQRADLLLAIVDRGEHRDHRADHRADAEEEGDEHAEHGDHDADPLRLLLEVLGLAHRLQVELAVLLDRGLEAVELARTVESRADR